MTVLKKPSQHDTPANITDGAGNPEWGSDLIMDLLRRLEIEYATLVPGNTFRGIHDSAVNYTANRRPELILCNHEMITVAMARGYAKATGRPMAVILHDVVGLINASLTIYDAWCDRVPVLILGGTEPRDAAKRGGASGWYHGANIQGNFVRGFTKWDDEPASVAAIPESLLRAYRLCVTEPAGPVYVNFDMELQEEKLPQPYPLPDVSRYRPAALPQPDDGGRIETARLLVGAELPMLFTDRVGRNPQSVRKLVELAELLIDPLRLVGRAEPREGLPRFSRLAEGIRRREIRQRHPQEVRRGGTAERNWGISLRWTTFRSSRPRRGAFCGASDSRRLRIFG